MIAFITTICIGIITCVLGIINMTGNISSLHKYHRHRVTEENKKPFGRLVGLGTLIIGISLIIFGTMLFIFEKTQISALQIVGNAVLIAGIIIGLVISFYAMTKYNKGIF